MTIKIYYPFVDLRKFNNEYSHYVTSRPNWPIADPGFIRCLGSSGRDMVRSDYCVAKNGLVLHLKKYTQFHSIVREIIFPYNTDFIGIYMFQFQMNDSTFNSNYKSVDKVFEMFSREVSVSVRNLLFSTETVNILKLKAALHKQYYWSTRLFEILQDNKPVKVENLDDNKMIQYLLSCTPYFVVESRGKASRIENVNNEDYFKYSDRLYHYAKSDRDKNLKLVHFQISKSFISAFAEGIGNGEWGIKELRNLTKQIIYFELFFDAISVMAQKIPGLKLDRSDILLKMLAGYLEQIITSGKGERVCFNTWKKYLHKTDTDYFKSIINKIAKDFNSSEEMQAIFKSSLTTLYQNKMSTPY